MATIRARSSLRRSVRFRSSATSSARDGKSITVTRGPAFRNRVSLAPNFLETLAKQYAGSRLERQELNAEFIDDVAGALWTRRIYDLCRLAFARPLLPTQRIVAIDPAANASSEKGRTSETGRIVAGLGRDERGHGLEVLSCRLLPRGWTCKAIAARGPYEPDALVVEITNVGAMVEAVLRAKRAGLPLRQVRANRGKTTRAEPIAARRYRTWRGRMRRAAAQAGCFEAAMPNREASHTFPWSDLPTVVFDPCGRRYNLRYVWQASEDMFHALTLRRWSR